ncbi:hypothetical protein AFM18_26505 [Achromobacter spanius]|uniref:Uncharacterized protein n=1 Tax=Achromobacter spanius TaxID=217203 RepID=A0AAW3HYK0_9BURK|nr:hypothetical protein AFM18_26505 [Achromobacter spanius]
MLAAPGKMPGGRLGKTPSWWETSAPSLKGILRIGRWRVQARSCWKPAYSSVAATSRGQCQNQHRSQQQPQRKKRRRCPVCLTAATKPCTADSAERR